MYNEQEIKDLKGKLVKFSDNYMTEMCKKTNLSRSTVFRFFNYQPTRPVTADKIYDAGLAFIDEQERKLEIRSKKARRLIYGENVAEEQPAEKAVQGRLNLNS